MDALHKFIFEGHPVRGMLVTLEQGWQDLLGRRTENPLPPPVQELLGQMAAASVLMQANIKFNGAVILQVQGDGPVKLAVAQAQPDLRFRATATVIGDVPAQPSLAAMVNVHGKGRCAITLDPAERLPGQQPYQGIVPLHGDQREPLTSLSQVLEHYMLQSEQLDTRLVLAANAQRAAGLLIQRLPVAGENNLAGTAGGADEDQIGVNESFNRIATLAATLTPDELLSLDAETILRRLFWEETIRRFEPLTPRFACTCSRERVQSMLRNLGRDECDSLIEERGLVEVICEYCGHPYRFDAVDVGELFTPPERQVPGSTTVN